MSAQRRNRQETEIRRPEVEISFAGPRSAGAFLEKALSRAEFRRADVRLTGAGCRLTFRLTVESWQRDAEPHPEDLTQHLIRSAQAAGGSVRLPPATLDAESAELAALADEMRAVRSQVRRMTRLAEAVRGAQDELGWARAPEIDRACRLARGLTDALEPLERLLAIFSGLARGRAPST